MSTASKTGIGERVDALDWQTLREQLDTMGHAITVPLLGTGETEELSNLFDGGRFRTTIDMTRHRFGDGRYHYFDHPLPELLAELRTSFYRHLAPIANDWSELLRHHPRPADRDGGHLPRLQVISRTVLATTPGTWWRPSCSRREAA